MCASSAELVRKVSLTPGIHAIVITAAWFVFRQPESPAAFQKHHNKHLSPITDPKLKVTIEFSISSHQLIVCIMHVMFCSPLFILVHPISTRPMLPQPFTSIGLSTLFHPEFFHVLSRLIRVSQGSSILTNPYTTQVSADEPTFAATNGRHPVVFFTNRCKSEGLTIIIFIKSIDAIA